MAWNGSDGVKAPQIEKKAPNGIKGVIAGVVIVVAALVAFFGVRTLKSDAPEREAKKANIPDVQPVKIGHEAPIPEAKAKTAADVARGYSEQAKDFITKTPTNEITWLVKPIDPNDPDYALHSQVAMEIRTLLAVEPGDPMPPVPFSFMAEDDARKALARGEKGVVVNDGSKDFANLINDHPIVEKEGDDESAVNRKLEFLQVQEELLGGLKDGLSVNDSIRAAYEFRVRAHEMRTQIATTLREIVDEGEPSDITRKVLDDANRKLETEGIKTISAEEIGMEEENEQ